MKRLLQLFGYATLCIAVLVSAGSVYMLWPRQEAVPVANAAPAHAASTSLSGTPTTISIPRFDLKLDVKQGKYKETTKSWDINDDDVFIDATQPKISNKPNAPLAFMYGHNTDKVLGKTAHLKVGDKMVITTSNGNMFTYSFYRAFVVKPNQTDVTTDTRFGKLALLSCNGILNDTRRVMYFNLEKAESK